MRLQHAPSSHRVNCGRPPRPVKINLQPIHDLNTSSQVSAQGNNATAVPAGSGSGSDVELRSVVAAIQCEKRRMSIRPSVSGLEWAARWPSRRPARKPLIPRSVARSPHAGRAAPRPLPGRPASDPPPSSLHALNEREIIGRALVFTPHAERAQRSVEERQYGRSLRRCPGILFTNPLRDRPATRQRSQRFKVLGQLLSSGRLWACMKPR